MKARLTRLPLVSITFPIHKVHEFAVEALDSLLKQTYPLIEILFLDNSMHGLESKFDLSDQRIRYYKLPSDYGLSQTLNFAIEHASGEYLARMDYDDISLPNRIAHQVEFMEINRDISISGTNIIIIGSSIDDNVKPGQEVKRRFFHNEIVRNLNSNNAFFHPTVIFRLDDLRISKLRYRPKFDSAEDLDLWCRASRILKLANLDEALLMYRLHPNQYSRLDGDTSNYVADRIRLRHTIWLIVTRKSKLLAGLKTILKLYLRMRRLKSLRVKSQFDKFL